MANRNASSDRQLQCTLDGRSLDGSHLDRNTVSTQYGERRIRQGARDAIENDLGRCPTMSRIVSTSLIGAGRTESVEGSPVLSDRAPPIAPEESDVEVWPLVERQRRAIAGRVDVHASLTL